MVPVPTVRSLILGTALGTLLLGAAGVQAQAPARTLVFDLSPFVPESVVGEVLGVGTAEGEVIHARLDATYVSEDAGPWSIDVGFDGFPMGGFIGVSSVTEGWAGVGTFTAAIESDAFNGTLAIPDGGSWYSWLMEWSGGKPFTLPGGGSGLGPVDGFFETLKLTLTLAPCPHGDPDLPWTDVGGALAGSLGAPVFTASGSLCGGESVALQLVNARPGGTTNIVLGLVAVSVPFKGGILVPSPDVIVTGLPINAAGVNVLSFAWPAGVPSDVSFWLQHWIADPAGPQGFAASNALSGTTP